MTLLASTVLIVLHTVDGYEISINPEHVTHLHPSRESAQGQTNQQLTSGVNCIVSLSDGKFLTVIEDCPTVHEMIEQRK